MAYQESIRLLEGGALDVEQISELFEGATDCMDFFMGLWKVVETLSCENVYNLRCDPRDERKRERVNDWKPEVRVCVFEAMSSAGSEVGMEMADGDLAVKQTVFDNKEDVDDDRDEDKDNGKEMCKGDRKSYHCGVQGCGQVLTSLSRYESHYHHCHNYVCDTCRRSFVSSFLLDIHLQENHDSYFSVLCSRIDMYRCLVESCQEKFKTPELRKDHLMTVHKFPSSFSFHQPIKDKSSANKKSRRKHHSTKYGEVKTESTYAFENLPLHANTVLTNSKDDDSDRVLATSDIEMGVTSISVKGNDTHKSEPSLKNRVPVAVCFGRGSQRAFKQRQNQRRGRRGGNWYQTDTLMETNTTVDIEAIDMSDLQQALT